MKTFLDLAALPALKEDLRHALPGARASDRIEALARGLGYNTYAALRAALARGGVLVALDDLAFQAYLAARGDPPNDRVLRRTLAKLDLRRAMDREADLTTAGFGVGWDRRETAAVRREKKRQWRADLLHDVSADEFELARLYVDQLVPRKTLNRDFSTYGLKHQAERLSRDRGIAAHLGNYVPNGVFIAAAISAGFTVKRCQPDDLNGFINATTPSIRAAQTGQLIDRTTASCVLGHALDIVTG
ncbi:hypothetical protein [Caulobacter sp.]|jgi:hypothetical protein|uniref:hypothetical protein n=1 Tax=Caulobacter sp. TaxID=78 RepID=UPI001614C7E9